MTQQYSNSYIQTYTRCPLACFYQQELHLARIDDDSSGHALAFGAAFHKALAVLYTESDLKKAQQTMRDYYPVQLDPNDLAKTADNACFALKAYWQHYDGDPDWEILACEGREFTEDGFAVKPDLVIRDRQGSILIVDHKTTKAYLNADYFSQFEPNSQITHYIRWCKEAHGGCDGFLINAINFLFLKRKSPLRAAGFNCEFDRAIFQRSPSQIERTVKATNDVIADIERSKSIGYWRANESSNACKFCSYRSLCSAGWSWEDDESLILSTFRRTCDMPINEIDEHCTLDHGHDGVHSSAVQSAAPIIFDVEL